MYKREPEIQTAKPESPLMLLNWYIKCDFINLHNNVIRKVSVYCQMYYSKQVAVFCSTGYSSSGVEVFVGAMGV